MNDDNSLTLKNIWWGIIIITCLLIIMIIVSIIVSHPYKIVFSANMDNNTLEAVKSMNWSAIPHE